MPPKSPVKEDEGKKTVNLAHYALVLANKNRADHGKIKVSEENSTLLLGMFRLIAKQLEALKIVSTYDIKV